MSYGRQTIMDAIRMAGSKLNQIDTAYADALVPKNLDQPQNMMDIVNAFGLYGRALPLSDVKGAIPAGFDAPYRSIGGQGPITAADARVQSYMDAAIMGANIASRYALPAGGVTLAGKGLYDLTAAFGNEADYQEPGQMPLS